MKRTCKNGKDASKYYRFASSFYMVASSVSSMFNGTGHGNSLQTDITTTTTTAIAARAVTISMLLRLLTAQLLVMGLIGLILSVQLGAEIWRSSNLRL